MADIHSRMYQVEVERAYRVVAILEQTAHDIKEQIVPKLQELLTHWRHRVLWADGIIFGAFMTLGIGWTLWTGAWTGLSFSHSFWNKLLNHSTWRSVALGIAIIAIVYGHFSIRKKIRNHLIKRLQREPGPQRNLEFLGNLTRAFQKNTQFWRSIFCKSPTGWEKRTRNQLKAVLTEANAYVQQLNDEFTNPSGITTISDTEGADVAKPISAQ